MLSSNRYLGLAVTVPDCRAPRLAKLYLAAATLATAWVGVASWFLLVWTLKVWPQEVLQSHCSHN